MTAAVTAELQIKKWGNSAGFRIPAELMQAGAFKIDQRIAARVEGNRLIIEAAPLPLKEYKLAELLAQLPQGYTEAGEYDAGRSVGAEALPREEMGGNW